MLSGLTTCENRSGMARSFRLSASADASADIGCIAVNDNYQQISFLRKAFLDCSFADTPIKISRDELINIGINLEMLHHIPAQA